MKKNSKHRTAKKSHPFKTTRANKLVVVVFLLSALAVFLLPLMVGRTPNTPNHLTTSEAKTVLKEIEKGLIDTKVTEAQPPENPDAIHAGAWCDHQPLWKESGLRRHVAVEGNSHVEINSFEVRIYPNGSRVLLGACVRLGEQPKDTDLSRMQAEGMFNENMHGTELEVTVQYTLKVSCCVRIKKSFVTRCVIGVTN